MKISLCVVTHPRATLPFYFRRRIFANPVSAAKSEYEFVCSRTKRETSGFDLRRVHGSRLGKSRFKSRRSSVSSRSGSHTRCSSRFLEVSSYKLRDESNMVTLSRNSIRSGRQSVSRSKVLGRARHTSTNHHKKTGRERKSNDGTAGFRGLDRMIDTVRGRHRENKIVRVPLSLGVVQFRVPLFYRTPWAACSGGGTCITHPART